MMHHFASLDRTRTNLNAFTISATLKVSVQTRSPDSPPRFAETPEQQAWAIPLWPMKFPRDQGCLNVLPSDGDEGAESMCVCAETRGRRRRSWLDLATARRCATGQLPSTLAEYGCSCLATVTVELHGREAEGGLAVVQEEERREGGDRSLQHYITTQLPTPPTIRCPRCLATEPPPLHCTNRQAENVHTRILTLRLSGRTRTSQKQCDIPH